jgi:dTDP-4-dehydrorhamnose reductase
MTTQAPKILITGKNGQVGWELQRALMPLGKVTAVDRQSLDLTDSASIRAVVQTLKPDIIVNAAAYTAVDKAESDRQNAMQINAAAPEILAEEAKKLNALLIHYSTDYVYDGTKAGRYVETDATNPVNYYGLSKLSGEQAIQAVNPDYLILRTSWVYGVRGGNFLLTMLRLMKERETLNVINDQHGTPTWSRLIAEVTAHILKQAVIEHQQTDFHSGVYHLTADGETTWHGFAEKIAELAASKVELAIKTIEKIPTSQYPTPAKRPHNSRISTQALTARFGLNLPAWDTALALCIDDLLQ